MTESPSSGDLNAGKTVTLTLNLSEAVTVAGGTPTLTLNDGGTATYTGGSGTNALTFSYTVGAGQNTRRPGGDRGQSQRRHHHRRRRQCRQPVALRPDPDRPADRHHDADDVVADSSRTVKRRPQRRQDRHADAQPERGGDGHGGTPTLTLNDGGTATYTGGSGTNALTFSYTVGRRTEHRPLWRPPRSISNGATITDGAGNAANLSLSGLTQTRARRSTPRRRRCRRIAESPASGDLNAGKTVTLTLDLSEAVTVAGGTPTLTLNDGGTATYTGGSGTNALTFSYTVGAGQNTAALAATAVNLNSRDHHRRRRQCRQPVALRPDPERAADRHHDAGYHLDR